MGFKTGKQQLGDSDARWDRPIAEGDYRTKLVDYKDPCDKHDECIRISMVPAGDAKQCPEGPVKIDFHVAPGWQFSAFLDAFDKPLQARIRDGKAEGEDFAMKPYKGRECMARVGFYEGRDDGVDHATFKKLWAIGDPTPGSKKVEAVQEAEEAVEADPDDADPEEAGGEAGDDFAAPVDAQAAKKGPPS